LLSTHSYSVLGVDGNAQRVKLRDPFGRTNDKFAGEHEGDGVIWLAMDDFVQNFTSVTVCYVSEGDAKTTECRQTIDVTFDAEKSEVSVPVIEMTVPKGGRVEYLGLAQKDLLATARKAAKERLDVCLFVLRKEGKGAAMDATLDVPCGYIPMSTQRNKFVKFGVSESEAESNDLSSGLAWKLTEVISEGTYYLVPWTSGAQWQRGQAESDEKEAEVRYIGLTVHGECGDGGQFTMSPVDACSGREVDGVLKAFGFKYGEKKQWQDLERAHWQCGQMDVYCGRNTCEDKHLLFTMTPSELTNVQNAPGFAQSKVGVQNEYKIEVGKDELFAVNVPVDPSKEFSSVYKYGLQNEWL